MYIKKKKYNAQFKITEVTVISRGVVFLSNDSISSPLSISIVPKGGYYHLPGTHCGNLCNKMAPTGSVTG